MAFTTKTWQNSPSTSTPISAAALQDIEARLAAIGLGGTTNQTTVGGTYSAVAGDVVLANQASGGFTVTLPTATVSTTVTVLAQSQVSPTNLVTIQRGGSATIVGPGMIGVNSFTLGTPGAYAILTSDGTNWFVASGGASAGTSVGGGATNIAASETRNIAQGALTAYAVMPTPDQVTGIVLPANGLIAVWYQATWQESVNGAAAAALFLGANQVKTGQPTSANPFAQAAVLGTGSTNMAQPLASWFGGVQSTNVQTGAVGYLGDVTTGQVVGGGELSTGSVGEFTQVGGPCYIFADKNTYTVSVQFKSSSGTVTASNRKLWVQALTFA